MLYDGIDGVGACGMEWVQTREPERSRVYNPLYSHI